MLTYRFTCAPYGPTDYAETAIDGGRRKALSKIRKLNPNKTGWKFVHSVSDTGLVRT